MQLNKFLILKETPSTLYCCGLRTFFLLRGENFVSLEPLNGRIHFQRIWERENSWKSPLSFFWRLHWLNAFLHQNTQNVPHYTFLKVIHKNCWKAKKNYLFSYYKFSFKFEICWSNQCLNIKGGCCTH